MNHLILAETEFFALNNEAGDGCFESAYGSFINAVIALCHDCADRNSAAIALAYTENELQYHHVLYSAIGKSRIDLYVRKALAAPQVPPLIPNRTSSDNANDNSASPLQWTGNAIDLVELIYGINEMGCINNGNMPLKQLAPLLYKIFGVKAKDCYRLYIDIKRRKNESRTYFLDKMQEKLNEKMLRDEEMERMRR